MLTKKISKVIVYYEDGTYEEIKASVPSLQGEQNKKTVSPSPVIPDFRPDTQKVQEWQPNHITWPRQPYYSPYTTPVGPGWRPGEIWCGASSTAPDNFKLQYAATSDARDMNDMGTWKFTSTGNFGNDNKYTITSTGNGNVDLSK